MYKVKNGTDSSEHVYSGAGSEQQVSEAERLRAKGEALRHSRYGHKEGNSVQRNREEEQKRSEQLKSRSGSRYADKDQTGEDAPKTGSRYADKQNNTPEKAQDTRQGSRYEEKQEIAGKPDTGSKSAAAEAPLQGNLWQRWIAGLKRRDSLSIAFLALVTVFIAGYSVVGMFYASHFYSGTVIFGIPCGKLTAEQTKEAVGDKIGEYKLTVEGRSGTEIISAKEVNLSYRDEGGIEKLLSSQKSYFWPVMMLLRKNVTLDVDTRYDESRIEDVLDQMECFREENVIRPEDAYLDTADTGYVVVPEVMGTLPDREEVKTVLMGALDLGLTDVSLDHADCYVKPAVYSDDPALNEKADEYNELLGAKITYDFGDRTEIVDTDVVLTFIEKSSDGSLYVSSDRICEYVYDLAQKYDTYGGYRSFRTSIGTVVDLYGGDYGWEMDQQATADELAEAIRTKQVKETEPIYSHTAKSRAANDIGGTYVEVCISLQEMWCYQNGVLMVDTPVVTGNPNLNNGTPSGGVWEIDGKYRDYTLVGPGYRCPVSYWMPFNEGVGIHDLQSRYYYGGSIYLYSGSHGCVNTPIDAVSEIYDIVSDGTPVIVYD